MELKPDFNRFLAAVRHKETDRVPLGEILIDYSIQSQFLGRTVTSDDLAGQVEFWSKAGYDFIPITVSMMSPGKVTEESKITRVLKELVLREKPGTTEPKAWNLEFTSFIHEREDLDKFPWEAAADIDFSKLHAVKGMLPEGMKVIAVSGKIFTLTWMLMGFNNFALKLVLDESFVAEVFERVASIQFKALEAIFGMDHVAGVWVVDDVAFGTGPMISPAAFRKHVFSWYKKVGERCHENNRVFLMHSDGDLTMLMDDLIGMGLDVIQPIDPSCMDMVRVKKQWGDRVCLIGNVSNELLRSGTTEEIAARVKELLRDVAPGGGFALGSGNSVPNWARFENYMAMRETCLKHGSYPIRL
ncbi:MAG: uroporphyrinogen decarboxylase family protein [Deltaproteobacteria bacterium]